MRLACVQSNVVFCNPWENTQRAISRLEHLKQNSVDLAVFPEAYLTGYCVDTREDAACIAIPRSNRALAAIREACDGMQIGCIVGFAEVDGEHLYNTAALFEPGQEPRYYRKTHLPELGLDKHVEQGDAFPIFDTKWGRIGILICFDLRAPEAARVLTLAGADLIVLPTNWPDGAEVSAEHMAITRAAENRVFVATCNRVGRENGFGFIGLSKIIGPGGKVLAAAGREEEIIQAEFNIEEARDKRNVIVPGKFETTVIESRRPGLYDLIAKQ